MTRPLSPWVAVLGVIYVAAIALTAFAELSPSDFRPDAVMVWVASVLPEYFA